MKIGILTFHFAHNYGAMLQAYALSTKLDLLGYDAEIVDYRHPYIYNNHSKLNPIEFYKNYRTNNNRSIALLKAIKNFPRNIIRDAKWSNFERFLNETLKKSMRIYTGNFTELQYDVLICGSDQIWNPRLTNGIQPIYFANIPNSNTKKIAYAASNGRSTVDDEYLTEFLNQFNQLDCISLREKDLALFLQEHTDKEITNVLDPVFLLNEKEWTQVTVVPKVEKYLLTYSFHEDELFYQATSKLAQQLKLNVISICYDRNKNLPKNFHQVTNAGPKELLGYFKNAEFVMTNSFHGTALSVLFNKQFYCIPPKLFRDRIDSLLNQLGIANRMIDQIACIDQGDRIDYKMVDVNLQKLKANSLSFLTKSLTN